MIHMVHATVRRAPSTPVKASPQHPLLTNKYLDGVLDHCSRWLPYVGALIFRGTMMTLS